MANPLKILTDLQVSGALGTSGSLSVGGNGSLSIGGNTAITSTQIGSTDFAITGSALSSSGEVKAGGLVTAANGVTVTGAALNASAVQVSASSLDVTNAASIGGDLTVVGNLRVKGTTTSVDSSTVNIGDLSLALASGSTTLSDANGAGFSVGSGSDGLARFQYNHASTAFKSSENLDLASGKIFKISGTEVLSATALGSNVVGSSLTSVGHLTGLVVSGSTSLSGTVLIKSNTQYGRFGLTTGSLFDLTQSLIALGGEIEGLEGQVNSGVSTETYNNRRSAVQGVKTSGQDGIRVILSGNLDAGSMSTAYVTGGYVQISNATASTVINEARYLSIDVAVRSDDGWLNDLTSVKITASQGAGGDTAWYPYIVIDAPAASTNTEIRLIVVNEKPFE
jgi:hypothetical protein